jgi:hypothetical protein
MSMNAYDVVNWLVLAGTTQWSAATSTRAFHENEVLLDYVGAGSGSWCEIPLLATSFEDCRVRIASSAGAEHTPARCPEMKAKAAMFRCWCRYPSTSSWACTFRRPAAPRGAG